MFKWKLDTPESGTAKEWRLWRQKCQKEHPILYFLQEDVPHLWAVYVTMPFWDRYWKIMHRIHPKHIHHIIKPRTLEPGYHDPREVILHACMHLLVGFVESHKAQNLVDWTATEEHNHAWNEMNEIYAWWTKERPVREEKFDKEFPYPLEPDGDHFMWMFDDDFRNTPQRIAWGKVADVHNTQEIKWDKEDDDYLHKLINIRQFMWD